MTEKNYKNISARFTSIVFFFSLFSYAFAANPEEDWHDCPTSMSYAMSYKAQCITLHPPLDYAQKDGQIAKLFIARYPAQQNANKGAPVFLLAGGPGQAGSDSFPALMPALEPIRRHHDLIVIDQRGTGYSESLKCPLPDLNERLDINIEEIKQFTSECLTKMDNDPRFFTTWEAAHDLEFIRDHLGIEKVILFGVSYGTRLATTYMRYFPDHLEKVILDSVVNVEEPLGLHHAINLQRTLDLITTKCAKQPQCNQQFPDLHQKLMALPERANKAHKTITIHHPSTYKSTEITVNATTVRSLVRLYAYSPEQVALLPWLINEAYQGHWDSFAAQGIMLMESLGETISTNMQNSVLCTEDYPLFIDSNFSDTFMGDELIDTAKAQCELWPTGYLDKHFREPLNNPTPTLLLEGEWDPVTPLNFAEKLAKQLPNSRILVAPGQGHFVYPRGCMSKLVGQFVDQTQLNDLDDSCLSYLKEPDFFLNANGPAVEQQPEGDTP
ncbi:MAG: alpha/beta hydrolase [bacterium]